MSFVCFHTSVCPFLGAPRSKLLAIFSVMRSILFLCPSSLPKALKGAASTSYYCFRRRGRLFAYAAGIRRVFGAFASGSPSLNGRSTPHGSHGDVKVTIKTAIIFEHFIWSNFLYMLPITSMRLRNAGPSMAMKSVGNRKRASGINSLTAAFCASCSAR